MHKSSNRKGLFRTIILAELLAGVLDGIAAIIQYALLGVDNPIRIFKIMRPENNKSRYRSKFSQTIKHLLAV